MTIEQILIGGIGAVTTALVFLFNLLWQRSEECEKDRRALRDEIEEVKAAAGVSTGTLKAFEKCPEKSCPFKVKHIALVVIIALILFVAGCSALDKYDRSYSFQYGEGEHAAKVGVTLHPVKGYAK